MDLLTRCAKCNTAFRLSAEQLSTRHGKVRCGSCGNVFRAMEHLVQPDAGKSPSDMESAPPDAEMVDTSDVASTSAIADSQTGYDSSSAPDTAAHAATETQPDTTGQAKLTAPLVDAPPPQPSRFRWISALGAFAASLLLGLQVAYFYRDDIAARIPATKPWLESMCVKLSCRFESPRDAQSISIESHDLQSDPRNKNLLVLVALLRNRASFEQDSPHLELTLTDALDAPLARRVFAPREFGSTKRIPSSSEVQVRIMLDASQVKASGYRIYAFYP